MFTSHVCYDVMPSNEVSSRIVCHKIGHIQQLVSLKTFYTFNLATYHVISSKRIVLALFVTQSAEVMHSVHALEFMHEVMH